jgi:TonB-dependent SusC/RagA subfamily outer membrane receptor
MRKDITGSFATAYSQPLENISAYVSFENVIQGRVAGVQIQPQNANPGTVPGIILRGTSSLAGGRNEPLYVVDGIPVGNSLNQNFSNGSIIGPQDIASIEILQAPEASALFGSAAANGVIIINTKSNINYHQFQQKPRKAKYSSLLITPRKFSVGREFYVDPPSKQTPEQRNDFRTTVYWNHTIVTNERGEASLSFYNNDATSSFRITAEGVSGTGLIGRKEEVYSTGLPFSIDTKIPEFLGFEDTLRLPVMIKNTTKVTLEGKLSISAPKGLKLLTQPEMAINVEAMKTRTVWVTVVSENITGEFPVEIKIESDKYEDKVQQKINVHPIGFPVTLSFSGKQLERRVQFNIQDMEKGSLKGEAIVFTDVLSDLFTGAESILREPHGCFEQVSSSTFPNILALQFLQESGQSRPDVENLALNYIKHGYKQLAAYEIKGGGFEWFGHPPAHEALTAYGLIEFHEMKKVYKGVDDSLLKRTRDWILGRRKGDGTFTQNRGKYGFSSASENVNNAYLVYALAETGTTEIEKEYRHSLDEALNSQDMYRMALMANAAAALQKQNDYQKLLAQFMSRLNTSGLEGLKMDHSVVRSYGNSLAIETISLWCVAMMRAPEKDLSAVNRCIEFILSKRANGMFGSTQATTLALKALTEFSRMVRTQREGGTITFTTNNTGTESKSYTKQSRDKIKLSEFQRHLQEGQNSMLVRFEHTNEPLPFSVNVSWNTKTPVSDSNCKVQIETRLMQHALRVNETVRLTVQLKNITHEGVPMTMGLLGIPAGLSLQPWQLKELQEKAVFDFYEVLGDRLAIYYRELEPNASRIINLDLKAEVPGRFTGVASCAYLYYTDEYKHWVKGSTVKISGM